MSEEVRDTAPAIIERLRLGTGFTERDRPLVLDTLRKLDRRLARFAADDVDMELSVKERDTPSQSLTLEVRIARTEPIVATSREPDLRDALMDVREDTWRQVDRAVNRRLDRKRR